ncbi:hypothetical protein BDV12DRAFT_210056 [Aspergillus spectabilis]
MVELRSQKSELQYLPPQHNNLEHEATPKSSNLGPDWWPQHPRDLKSNARSDISLTILKIILASFSIAFLVLAILAIRLNGQEISGYGDGIIQATNLGPYIIPIVFAAIVGNMMRSLALWRAEKGTALGIQHLNGSTSPGMITILTLLIWTLSHIGGQTDIINPINLIYSTLIISSQDAKAAQRDIWGWPKIPLLHEPTTYSSLIGLVMQGIPADKDTEFLVESSYFDLNCHLKGYNLTQDEVLQEMGPLLIHKNSNDLYGYTLGDSSPEIAYSNFFIDISFNFTSSSQTLNASCIVSRMRQSETDTRPSSLVPPNDPHDPDYENWTIFRNLVLEYPHTAGALQIRPPRPTYGRNWNSISAESVSRRLTTAFNTYYQASLAPFIINSASISDPVNLTQDREGGGIYPFFNSTEGTTSRSIRVYYTNSVWVAILITATTILQLSAFADLEHVDRGREVGHISLVSRVGGDNTAAQRLRRQRQFE